MAGTLINAPTHGETGTTAFLSLDPCDRVLFDETTEGDSSPVFRVPNDGHGVLLTGFNLCGTYLIEMVKIDIQDMPSGNPNKCCVEHVSDISPTMIAGEDSVDQSLEEGSASWAMVRGANIGVLTVPGAYRLVSASKAHSGCFTFCAKLITPEAMRNIPSQLLFGNTL